MSTLTISQPKVKVITITPDMAAKYLEQNTKNRPLNQRKVEELVKAMEDGEWKLGTDAIGFDTNGRMINGQHRMTALVEYGRPLEFLVTTGLEPEAFNVIDTGRMRSAGDVLTTEGIASGHHKSAIIRFVYAYKKGVITTGKEGTRDSGMNNQDVLDYAFKYRNELEEAYNVSVEVGKDFKGLKGREVGGMFWILAKIDKPQALDFFRALGTGAMLSADNPIYVLRQRLLDELRAKKKFPMRDKLAWLIVAWNHVKRGTKTKIIKWDGITFPKPE